MKYAVLGLGESLSEYKHRKDVFTFGVNDIYSKIETDYVICIDPKRVFSPERISVIENCKPHTFFSNIIEWKDTQPHFQILILSKPRSSLIKLDQDKICYSICSPYVACVMAYKLGASEITMYGCDFNSHKTLSVARKQAIIKRDFTNLFHELKSRNVKLMVGSEKSFLAKFIPVNRLFCTS